MPQDTGRRPQPIRNGPQSVEETIRTRAYELYERKDGHELEDWLRAEEEVTKRKIRTTAA